MATKNNENYSVPRLAVKDHQHAFHNKVELVYSISICSSSQTTKDRSDLQGIMLALTSLPTEILRQIVQDVFHARSDMWECFDDTIYSLLYVNHRFRDLAVDVYTKSDLKIYGTTRSTFKEMQKHEVNSIATDVKNKLLGSLPGDSVKERNTEHDARVTIYECAPFRLACIIDNMFPDRHWKYVWRIARLTRSLVEDNDRDWPWDMDFTERPGPCLYEEGIPSCCDIRRYRWPLTGYWDEEGVRHDFCRCS